MQNSTIQLPALSFRASLGEPQADSRTIPLVWSTGAPVQRYDWQTGTRFTEILSMDPAHVRLDRLNEGASLLDSHSAFSVRDVLGAVVPGSVSVTGGEGTAHVRFSDNADVEPVWNNVKQRIVRHVSIGYLVHAYREDVDRASGTVTRTAVDWEPFEVSMVPVPADAGAHVRAARDGSPTVETRTFPCLVIREGKTMSDPVINPPAPAAAPAAPPAPIGPTADQIRADERARISGITEAVRVAQLDQTFAAELIGAGMSLEAARAAVLAKMAEQSQAQPISGTRIEAGEDARDKWVRGAANWIFVRSGLATLVARYDGIKPEAIDPGEFRGLSLLDLAKESLTRAGVAVRGLSRMEIAGLAMTRAGGYQTTSDFAVLLESVLNKVLRAGYAIQPDTWSRFCGVATASDFRSHTWYRTGALSDFEDVNEHGEFKNKAIPDAEKASYSVKTKGNMVAISRQTIINDDLGAMTRLTEALGRAGKLTIEKAVYALLAQNSGLGPTQSDSQPLFHSNRANVGTGAALAAAALDADRVVMRSQKEPGGQDYADLQPAVLLVPVGLGGQARIINESQFDPDTVANKAQNKPNVAGRMFSDIVDTPRISGTRRYLFADPQIAPVFVVSFLEGQREPVLEAQDGWRIDGVELKGRLDVGVDAVDYRGAVTNAGA